jgi:hypothetical protein
MIQDSLRVGPHNQLMHEDLLAAIYLCLLFRFPKHGPLYQPRSIKDHEHSA